MNTPSLPTQLTEILDNLPDADTRVAYYNKNTDTLYVGNSNPVGVTSKKYRWLSIVTVSSKTISWQIHHSGRVLSKLHLNPVKSSRAIASILNWLINIPVKKP